MKPKFQSEMQSGSYLPVCSTIEDLPSIDSSRIQLQNNNDQIQINRHGYNSLYSPCNTSQLKDHEKEKIKKTMLQHEAIFKHQVSELHRVYNKQRELMDEIKTRGLCTNYIEGKTSNSNPIMCGGMSKSDQAYHVSNFTSVDPSCHWPTSTFNFQVASNFDAGKSMQAATNKNFIASSLKDTVLLPSSSKEFRKRTFDLELPADEYIDHEEEIFEDGTVSGFSKVSGYGVKDLSAASPQKELSMCKDQLNPSEGTSSETNLIPSIINLGDMNKTLELKKEGTLYSTSLLSVVDTSNMGKPHLKLSYSQKPKTVFQVQTKDIDCMQIGKDLENRSDDVYLEKASRKHEHASSNHLISATEPFGAPASLSKNATLSIGSFCLNNNICLSRSLAYDPSSLNVGSLQNNLLPRSPAEHIDSSSMFSGHLSNLTNSLEMVTTHGNEKIDSTIQGLNWPREKLVPGGISDKVREESLNQGLGLRLPKEFHTSSSDIEAKWHGTGHILNYGSIHGSSIDLQLTNDQLSKLHPNLSEVRVADNYEKIGMLDRRSAHALTVSKMNWSAQSEVFKNVVYRKCHIDLNSSLNEDGTEQMEVETKNAADINLEPPVSPVSPENKESSPPRGNSMEKQPTESVELTAQDDKCQEDLVLVAAEALVLMSSNSAECLKWFAGVVLSAANDVEEQSGAVEDRLADNSHSERTSSSLPKRRRTRRTKSQKAIYTISGPRENERKAKSGEKNSSKNEQKRGKKHNSKSNVLLQSLEGCLPGWGSKNNRQAGQRRPAPNLANLAGRF